MSGELALRWAATLVDELVRGGLRHAVISPGSRSSPLALALVARDEVRAHVVLDERSAGFVALGLAKATGELVGVLCTSGTAGAHLYPATIEARQVGARLVLVTADRPWELQGFGAPQTVDQEGLLRPHVRRSERLGEPDARPERVAHARAVVARALDEQCRLPGPVHLNVPFSEPLLPAQLGAESLAPLGSPAARLGATPRLARRLPAVPDWLRSAAKGLIVCGPREHEEGFAAAVDALARRTGFAVLADVAGNARERGGRASCRYDAWLRSVAVAQSLRPDVVVRFGGPPTSKVLQRWLASSRTKTLVVCDSDARLDPWHQATEFVEASAAQLVEALGEGSPAAPGYARAVAQVEDAVESELEQVWAGDGSLCEPRVAREVSALLPEGAQWVLAGSMPIRDADGFAVPLSRGARVLANRGANGIDGMASTALGAALARRCPTVLQCGDLAAIHDLGGFVAAGSLEARLATVVVNNGGGGIFHFLPVARAVDRSTFERVFVTPQAVDLEHVAGLARATLHRPQGVEAFRRVLRDAIEAGRHLIEVRTDRVANEALHRQLAERLSCAAERALA